MHACFIHAISFFPWKCIHNANKQSVSASIQHCFLHAVCSQHLNFCQSVECEMESCCNLISQVTNEAWHLFMYCSLFGVCSSVKCLPYSHLVFLWVVLSDSSYTPCQSLSWCYPHLHSIAVALIAF